MSREINFDQFDTLEEEVPEEKWIVRPNDDYDSLIVISAPFWRRHKKLNCKFQFVYCLCKCGNEFISKATSIKNKHKKHCIDCGRNKLGSITRKGTLAVDGFKICTICQKKLPVNEYPNCNYTIDKLYHSCFKCSYFSRCKSIFRIDITGIKEDELICPICSTQMFLPSSNTSRRQITCIDHNHKTGQVRGIICSKCNTAIGQVEENIDTLKNLIKYLENGGDPRINRFPKLPPKVAS